MEDLSAVWKRPDVLEALACRDIPTLYRTLACHGYAQHWIARQTGQSQSEVSEIIQGRHVRSYDLLARIAEGLGIPRGLLGLSYTAARYQPPTPEEEDMKRRAFLSLVSSLALGGSVTEEQRQQFTPTMDLEVEPFVGVVRESDAKALTAIVDAFRDTDMRFGGYGQYQGVLAAVKYGESLLADADDRSRRAILSGTAYCHSAAGWFAMEEAHLDAARYHYANGLELAKEARDPWMSARILYCAGRTELHFDAPQQALKLFQLGTVAAQRSPLLTSVLEANSAWATAELGRPDLAQRSLDRAQQAHASVDFARDTPMFRWFGAADLASLIGVVHLAMEDYSNAATNLDIGASQRSPEHHRSQVFDRANLAHAHLMLGNTEEAVAAGQRVLDHAERVRSARLSTRLTPLYTETTKRCGSSGDVWQLSRELQQRIDAARVPV